jgi:hypothetical protein
MTPVKDAALLNDIATSSPNREGRSLPPNYDVLLLAKVPRAIASTGKISCSGPLENHAPHARNCR